MTAALQSPAWMEQALCREVPGDEWFPEKGERCEAAKAICRSCPVQALCLEYALVTDQRWGVWGGLSERERARLPRPQLCARCLTEPVAGAFRYCEPCRRQARIETYSRYQGKAS